MTRPTLVLVTPALADANNGNWHTARRWARLLGERYRVVVRSRWQAGDTPGDLLIALHAFKSAGSVAAWPLGKPVVLALTGTDLYRDLGVEAMAQASVQRADALVVLNRCAPAQLPAAWRAKAQVVLQSCAARGGGPRPQHHLRAVMVGHLRDEKDPRTLFAAVRRLAGRKDIRIDHIGRALDPALGAEAQALMRDCPHYRWLGGRSHADARARMARASVLVHASRMEGGAQVIIEALRAGTPVLASRMDGNVGLLGADWPALFPVGDAGALAQQLVALREQPAAWAALQNAAMARSADFTPECERAALLGVIDPLLR